MGVHTYDAVRKAERHDAQRRASATPYQNFLTERQADLACAIVNLDRAKAILNDDNCPLAVERALSLVTEELVSLMRTSRKLTAKALDLQGQPNGTE